MNWIKTLGHDVRRGLLRWRYLVGFALYAVPCVDVLRTSSAKALDVTWLDYMISCFPGVALQSGAERSVEVPVFWLLIMAGANLMSLDYFFADLSREGQQILLRCKSRRSWYLSKCVWNLLSSSLYFCTGMVTAAVFTLISRGSFSLNNTPELLSKLFMAGSILPTGGMAALLTTVLAPWATICALNMAQMAMVLYIKPVYSFLGCMVVLLAAAYVPSAWCLGNGAMMLRSAELMAVGLPVWKIWAVIGVWMAGSFLIGMIRIRKMDLLTVEV